MNKIQMTMELEIPEWATHIAQDEDGMWYSYRAEPHIGDCQWDSADASAYAGSSANLKDWRQELYTLEWEYY